MRILQVCSAERVGGGELHVLDLCHGLKELGHEVHLATRPGSELLGIARKSGIGISCLPFRNSADIVSALRLRRILAAEGIDIVHAHVGRDYVPAALAARGLGTGLVLTRHHYYPFRAGPFYERLIGNAGLVIAVSQAVADGICKSLPSLSGRIRVIPNWLRTGEPYPGTEARHRLGITRAFAIGVVGEITSIKGQELVARAFAGMPDEVRNRMELVLVGRVSSEGYRREILEIYPETRFAGEVPEAGRLMSAFDVVVVPSQGEGFSLAAIEAMRAGVTVACSRTPALEELIVELKTGRFFRGGDQAELLTVLIELLSDPDQRRVIGKAAREDAMERFERTQILRRIESEYQSLARK